LWGKRIRENARRLQGPCFRGTNVTDGIPPARGGYFFTIIAWGKEIKGGAKKRKTQKA